MSSQRHIFPEKYKYVYQTAVVLAATMFNVAAVVSFAWPSPAIPKLMEPDSVVPITAEQGTLIVSFLKVGQILSPLPTAWMMDRFGRKTTLLIGTVPLLSAWIMLALAERFELLCVFTFLAGWAIGMSYLVLPMYIAEISSDHIRGYLGVLQTVTGKSGLLFMYAIGPFVAVRTMAWVCTIPVIIFLLTAYWIPESPYHLLAKDRRNAARDCLASLRCTTQVDEEFHQMEASVAKSQENKGTFRELFFNPGNRQSLITVLGLSALPELCGSQIVLLFAQLIFASLNTGLDAKFSSIIFGVVQLAASVLACFLVDSMGRRPLMMISVIGTGLCNVVIGVYFILERYMDVSGIGWIPLVAIMVYMVMYTIGIIALLTVITAEIFPKHLKGVAGSVKYINSNVIGLILVYVYQFATDSLGSDYVFMGFAVLTFAFVPFVLYQVPETKRQPLDTILDEIRVKAEKGLDADRSENRISTPDEFDVKTNTT